MSFSTDASSRPDDKDRKQPVAIVDDMLARQLWPDRSAVGMQIFTRAGSERVTVVGVVRHLRLRSLVDDLMPQIYVPWMIAQRNPMAYVVRSERGPIGARRGHQAAVAALDSRLAIYDVRPLDALRRKRSFHSTVHGAAGGCVCGLRAGVDRDRRVTAFSPTRSPTAGMNSGSGGRSAPTPVRSCARCCAKD